jgi:hypothetical protein
MSSSSPLTLSIRFLLDTHFFKPLEDQRYQCPCGSVLKRSSLSNHLKHSKHHQTFMVGSKGCPECPICYESVPLEDHWFCNICRNHHCWTCHKTIRTTSVKCPFCRSTCRDGALPPSHSTISLTSQQALEDIQSLIRVYGENILQLDEFEPPLSRLFSRMNIQIEIHPLSILGSDLISQNNPMNSDLPNESPPLQRQYGQYH